MKCLLFACLSLPLSVLGQGGLPNSPYIYVEGKAEVDKPADLVTLRFDVVARNADQVKANREVQAKATKIFNLLKDKSITAPDVVAADVKSAPQFEENDSDHKRGKLAGYSVTRNFAIKVRDLTVFPTVVDELFAIGAIEFSDIQPGLANEKKIQEEIWEKALLNAREQADKTVKALGMKIDSVFAVSQTAFPRIREQMFGSEYGERMTERANVTGPPEYPLGPLTVSQNVHVIYLISPSK